MKGTLAAWRMANDAAFEIEMVVVFRPDRAFA
jgi:hypothetical protein